jgi:hypothetical protein
MVDPARAEPSLCDLESPTLSQEDVASWDTRLSMSISAWAEQLNGSDPMSERPMISASGAYSAFVTAASMRRIGKGQA